MILLITIPLAAAISLAWYLPCVKALGDNHVLQKKDYLLIALKYGFAFTCLLIVVTEILWDGIVKRTPLTGLAKDITADFLRAALLEEFFKFRGFILAKKKYALTRKIDYMLTAGLIGLVYGFFEKIVLGNIGAVIIGFLCPMHIMWQFNQGGHYYEYEKAKAANDEQIARKEWLMAVLLPFLFHGFWDTGLDIGSHLLENQTSVPLQVTGMVLITAMVAGGIVYTIKTIRRVCKTAKEAPAAEPRNEPVSEGNS